MADNDQWLHDADRLDIPGPRKVKRPRVQLDSEKFGQFAEATARFMGTAKFLVYMTVIVCSWVIWNLVAIYKLRFDPYPFILLNLFFSTLLTPLPSSCWRRIARRTGIGCRWLRIVGSPPSLVPTWSSWPGRSHPFGCRWASWPRAIICARSYATSCAPCSRRSRPHRPPTN